MVNRFQYGCENNALRRWPTLQARDPHRVGMRQRGSEESRVGESKASRRLGVGTGGGNPWVVVVSTSRYSCVVLCIRGEVGGRLGCDGHPGASPIVSPRWFGRVFTRVVHRRLRHGAASGGRCSIFRWSRSRRGVLARCLRRYSGENHVSWDLRSMSFSMM